MGGGEDFLLKWNDHHSLFFTGAEELLEKEEYTDVTLAAGNRFFSAHRLVLSICSPFFQSLFKRLGNQKTVIFMKDIEPQHLELLLEYMYKGEIKVQESELVNVLSAAQSLEVKGLTDSGGGGGGNTKSTSNKSSNIKQDPVPSHTSSPASAATNTTVGGTKRPSPGPVGGGGVSTDSPARKRANLSTKDNNLSSISNATATSQQHSSSTATTAVVKQEHQQHHDVVTITDPRPPVIADVRRHHHHQSWTEEGAEGEDYEEGGEGEEGVYGEGGEGVEEGEVTALGGEHMEGGEFDQSGEGYAVEELGGYDEGEYYEGGGVAGEGAAGGGGGINISQEEDRAADMMGDGRLLSVRFLSSRFAICKYCNKDFKTPSLLDRHITVHTKEKKFVCVCGRGYTRSDRLRKHMDMCAVGGCAAKENVVVTAREEKTTTGNAAKMRKMNKKAGKGVGKASTGVGRLHSLEDFFDENVHEEDEGDEEPYIVHPFIVSE